jgi:hypothetical protein
MLECKPVQTPMESNQEIDESAPFSDANLFRSLVGSLIYLSTMTRPDISFAVRKISQKMQSPSINDWQAAKRVLRYLKGTSTLGLFYSTQHNNPLEGYSDSDWASDKATRKSITGYVFTLQGAAISWSSKQQSTRALSSTEAEYTALAATTQESAYLNGIFEDLDLKISTPTTIYADNQGAIHIAHNNITSQRSKHFDIKLHYTRQAIMDKKITVKYIPTEDMLADQLTKPVGKNKLQHSIKRLFGYDLREGVNVLKLNVSANHANAEDLNSAYATSTANVVNSAHSNIGNFK